MPHAVQNRQWHHHVIKREPSPLHNAMGREVDTAIVSLTDHQNSAQSDFDQISNGTADEISFHMKERSDAPPPSERMMEPECVLREIRSRHLVVPATSLSQANESFFHNSFEDIGKKLKECNDTLGELHQLGVSHDVQLPELVLVGDQSAGKSSLMSGLAHIDLPRSEGTCTRCPLHIRVSRNTDWSCRVSLRKDYCFKPPFDGAMRESDVTELDPFFPWKKRSISAVHEFKTMHDNSEIEDALRWAQIAILNDDKDHDLFVPGSGRIAVHTPVAKASEEAPAKFSPNVVALEIKGPGLPDLSFYDMPGIFQSPADPRDDYLVNVVRNLSKAYILHPSAMVICSVPMNSDAENSSTFGLIRKLGAENRTIGVLTKADLLPEGGSYEQWLAIMRRETHLTGLGYFITSRPPGKDLNELEQWEELIFRNYGLETWPVSLHPFSNRCGIERLKIFLSERLGEEFVKRLPDIKAKVKSYLEKITKQLASLPELPENIEVEIQSSLITFAESARAKMDDFASHFNTLPRNFRDCLLEIKPKFTLKDKSDTPVLEISDDEPNVRSTSLNSRTPSIKRNASILQSQNKRSRNEAPVSGINTSCGVTKAEDSVSGLLGFNAQLSVCPRKRVIKLPEPFGEFTGIGLGFRTLRQVREEMQAKTKAGMPDRVSDKVYVDLVKEAIEPWKKPTEVFIKQTMQELQFELEATLNRAFAKLKKRCIYNEARNHLRGCLTQQQQVVERALLQLYNDEREWLLTFNEDAFKQYRDDEHNVLVRFRHNVRLDAVGMVSRPLDKWSDMTEEKRAQDSKRREAEMHTLGPDQFARELEVVAYVRGYYRLAALRFADAASQQVLCRMIPAIRQTLSFNIEDKLGLQNMNKGVLYERLMAEDEATAMKRDSLKQEKQKFTKALSSIEDLESDTTHKLQRSSEGIIIN